MLTIPKRLWKSAFGKEIVFSEEQKLIITTRKKDFAFEELNSLPDGVAFFLVFDGNFYSLYADRILES